jgi:predicted transcriptional regulator
MSNRDSRREALLDEFLQQSHIQTAATLLLESAIAERLKINVIDLHCANLLRFIGSMTAGKLAEATGLTTGAITGMLDRLEKIGFVRREIDPADRRRVIAHAQKDTMDSVIGPLYESLMHASHNLVGDYSDEQLSFMVDHMRRSNALMMDETQRIRRSAEQRLPRE